MADAPQKFKVGDRVKRANRQGCSGTVKALRTEVTSKASADSEKNLMINVQWDNGTASYFCSESLEAAKN